MKQKLPNSINIGSEVADLNHNYVLFGSEVADLNHNYVLFRQFL